MKKKEILEKIIVIGILIILTIACSYFHTLRIQRLVAGGNYQHPLTYKYD